jgi:hypothetical protein
LKSLLEGRIFRTAFFLPVLACSAAAESSFPDIDRLVDSVREASFPQLRGAEITVHDLRSDYVFLETRFTLSSYFFGGRLRYMLMFNREASRRKAPAEGLRAIVAHELAHIDYFQKQSRMGLAGLVRLLSPSFTAQFERKADLETIVLGYGRGLEIYRTWLYLNIPRDRIGEKKRDYFSPEEIETMLRAEKQHPGMMRTFVRCVPRNLAQIEAEVRNPGMVCTN